MKRIGIVVVFSLLLLLLLAAGYLLFHRYVKPREEIYFEARTDTLQAPANLLYGIPADSFYIRFDKVRKNQTMTDLLKSYNMLSGTFYRLLTLPHEVFDMRRIRAGNDFAVFLSPDSLARLCYFIYEQTPVDYVVFDFRDSLNVYLNRKEVKMVEKAAAGNISSSLWNTLVAAGANPQLAIDLSEIYAWTIDFFGLQVNDSFRVIYNEMYVDTLPVGNRQVEAAWFRHAGREFYAIPFVQDSFPGFYDLEGNSLKKAFLKSPLQYSRISSRFSHGRLHPILKIVRPHHGVDYAAPIGTPVRSIGDGTVVKISYDRGGGRMIRIKHNSVYSTAYLHLSNYAKDIRLGGFVKQGDVIGYVGSTGLSTGPHLDFRFYKNNMPIDPLKVESPPIAPIDEDNKQAFDSVKAILLRRLEQPF